MARSLESIYNELVTQKEASTYLTGLAPSSGETFADLMAELTSQSKVAIWRLWAYVVAFNIWTHEKLNDVFQLEMEQWVETKQVPTLKWYRSIVLNYLHGKPLIWSEDNGHFYQELLPSDDENTLKVVKYCATTPSPGVVRVKVAKDNGGVPGVLSPAEVAGIESFLDQVKAAGDTIEVVNNTADLLNIELVVYVDPLVVDITTGELHTQPGVNPSLDAINNYLLNLEFNGRFVRNYFIDELQKAVGVTNVDINVLQWKYASFAYSDIDVSVVPDAGYFEIDNLNISYLPKEN